MIKLIDKNEVLKIIDDVTSETIINVGQLFHTLTSRINKLPTYDNNNLPKGFKVQLDEQKQIIDDDTELLKACYELFMIEFIYSDTLNEHETQVINMLRERLGIND